MGITKHTGARAIILSLSMTPFGAQAVVETPATQDPINLSGLVAEERHDDPSKPWSTDAYAEAKGKDIEGCEPDGCCDPSGCATFMVQEFRFAEDHYIPGELQVAYVAAKNGEEAVSGATITLDVFGGEIVNAPGCQTLSETRAECLVSDLRSYQTVARTIVVAPNYWSQGVSMTASTRTSASTVNFPYPFLITSSKRPVWANEVLRITNVDASACPIITATVSETDSEGFPTSTHPVSYRFSESDRFVVANAIPAGDIPRSIAILIDNSLSLPEDDWNSMLDAVSVMVHGWRKWSTENSVSMPDFSIYTLAPVSRKLTYTSNPAVIDTALAALVRQPRATSIYSALDTAATDLAARSGDRIAVLMAGGTDAQGATQRDEVVKLLQREKVNVYGVALQPAVEPLMIDLSKATTGFRQTPSGDSEFGWQEFNVMLGRISNDLRSSVRYRWTTPFREQAPRTINLTTAHSWINASSNYMPEAPNCVTPCVITRVVPPRVSPYENITVTLNISNTFAPDTISVSEQIPVGWIVWDIDSGGVLDYSSNTLFWDLQPGQHPLSLSYTLAYASSTVEDLRFSGVVKSSNGLVRTCGSAGAEMIPFSPAGLDGYPYDPDISDANVAAYALAWKTGSRWFNGRPQIPASYVTRSWQIQMNGIHYRMVDASPPWIVAGTVPPAGPRSSSRAFPDRYEPGTPFQVTLTIDPGTASSANAVEEVPPAGWVVSAISDGGHYDPVGRVIRWGPFKDDAPRALSYELSPPSQAYGTVVFTGRLSVDGVDSEIDGGVTLNSERIFANGFD